MENKHESTKLSTSVKYAKIEALINEELQGLIEEFPELETDNFKLFAAAMAFGLELGLSGELTKNGADNFAGYIRHLFDL